MFGAPKNGACAAFRVCVVIHVCVATRPSASGSMLLRNQASRKSRKNGAETASARPCSDARGTPAQYAHSVECIAEETAGVWRGEWCEGKLAACGQTVCHPPVPPWAAVGQRWDGAEARCTMMRK